MSLERVKLERLLVLVAPDHIETRARRTLLGRERADALEAQLGLLGVRRVAAGRGQDAAHDAAPRRALGRDEVELRLAQRPAVLGGVEAGVRHPSHFLVPKSLKRLDRWLDHLLVACVSGMGGMMHDAVIAAEDGFDDYLR